VTAMHCIAADKHFQYNLHVTFNELFEINETYFV